MKKFETSDNLITRRNFRKFNFDLAGMIASYLYLHCAGLALHHGIMNVIIFNLVGITGIISSFFGFYFIFQLL